MAREVKIVKPEVKDEYRYKAQDWARRLSDDLWAWGKERGLSGRASIAKAMDIPPSDRGWRTIMNATGIVGAKEWLYAHIYQHTSLSSSDPRTMPVTVGKGNSREVVERAWSEEKWQQWLQNPESFKNTVEEEEGGDEDRKSPIVNQPRAKVAERRKEQPVVVSRPTDESTVADLKAVMLRQQQQIDILTAQMTQPSSLGTLLEAMFGPIVAFLSVRIAQDIGMSDVNSRLAALEGKSVQPVQPKVEKSIEYLLDELLEAIKLLMEEENSADRDTFLYMYGVKAAHLQGMLMALVNPDPRKREAMRRNFLSQEA